MRRKEARTLAWTMAISMGACFLFGMQTPVQAGSSVVTTVDTWSELVSAVNSGDAIKLTADVVYGEGGGDKASSALQVAQGSYVVIDLNGHVIDRNLDTPMDDGYVIKNEGELRITDSNPDATHAGKYTVEEQTATGTQTKEITGGIITGGNNTGNGGGIYNYANDKMTTFNLEGGTLFDNHSAADGGGIYNIAAGNDSVFMVLRECRITQNSAVSGGGGIYNSNSKCLTNVVGECIVTGNWIVDAGQNTTTNNVELLDNAYIQVSEKLTGISEIGVTTDREDRYIAKSNENIIDMLFYYEMYFTSDNTDYVVTRNDGNDYLVLKQPTEISSFSQLKGVMEALEADDTGIYKLVNDIRCESANGSYIWTVQGTKVVLDLNGHVIDSGGAGKEVGDFLAIASCGDLFVRDSSPAREHTLYLDDNGIGSIAQDDFETAGTKTLYGGIITGGNNGDYIGDGAGGGALSSVQGNFYLLGGCLYGNYATLGGGIHVGSMYSDDAFIVLRGEIMGNSSQYGGAIHMEKYDEFEVDVTDSVICDNSALYNGGAIWSKSFTGDGDMSVNLNQAHISNNEAGQCGGAIYNTIREGTCDITISDSELCQNKAGVNGGGIYMDAGELTVTGDVTVTNNLVCDKANNVYLPEGKMIGIDALSKQSKIGLTTQSLPATFTDVLENADAYAGCFSADAPEGVIGVSTDQKLMVERAAAGGNDEQETITSGDSTTKDTTTSSIIGKTYKVSGNKYKVTSASAVACVSIKNKSKVTIPDKVKIAGKNYKVTAIASKAAAGNKKIKKLSIGKNVKSIGDKAFFKCKKLKSITIKTKKLKLANVGNKAFKGIAKKAKVSVPKKVKKLYTNILKMRGAGKKVKVS
ncbi:MAG: leucine-rich repeat domain-containing protein [Eubacterium sp.]|nr:leucine-rich repeat domain-containing protein [Eubacterium sp.]